MSRGAFSVLIAALLVGVAGCSSSHSGQIPHGSVTLVTPKSVSPALVKTAPMAKTAILPASAMTARFRRKPMAAVGGLSYTQIPGSGTFAAASPDGSLWVLSDQPAGADKYIWHYANGTWTNISGLASRLSVGPDGTLYAINASGGAYAYSGGTWAALGGGCRDITVGADGSVYVISDAGGADGAIWHYASSTWTQEPGSGNRIAASWDTKSYTVPGGTIAPGGFYVLNSAGSIYYLSGSSYVQLPGAATAVAPISGGVFALGSATGGDAALYYDDLANPGWTSEVGSGTSLSASNATLYIVNSGGGIYAAQIATALSGSTTYNSSWAPYGVASGLDFPVQHGWNGSGEKVGIVIDSDVNRTYIKNYLNQFGITQTGTITTVSVDGATGIAGNGDQIEAYLDVETVAGLAPGADIYIYQMPDLSDQSIADAYSKLDNDGIVSIANSSFGGCEYSSLPEDPFIAQGAQAGILYVASSGDSGNACDNTTTPFSIGASWPASNPNVVAAGGTATDYNNGMAINNNAVWNDRSCGNNQQCGGGGGVSKYYPLPAYQNGLAGASSTSMRNEPDISMPGEDVTVYIGAWTSVNGTSWSSPEFAALMAEVYEYCHLSSGLANPVNIPYYVDSKNSSAYIDVISGNDQMGTYTPFYTAGPGYDNASGFGVPMGMKFADTLCPGGVKGSGVGTWVAPRTAVSTAMASAAGETLNVTPRVAGLADEGERPAPATTRIMIVLRSDANRSAVEQALSGAGFTIDRTYAYPRIVHAVAASATVERFFGTHLHNVVQARYGERYMPVSAVTVPPAIAPYVSTVNLDNVITRHVLTETAPALPF